MRAALLTLAALVAFSARAAEPQVEVVPFPVGGYDYQDRAVACNLAMNTSLAVFHAAHADRRVRRSPNRYWGHDEVNEIYANARALTRRTGVRHHVDHILPIKHPLVSGLHVPENLQILTARDNSRKRNKIPAELAHLFADLPKEQVWTR